MIRSMISSMISSMVNPFDSAISRYFTQLDPVANAYYELATPITLTGDFEIDYATTSAAAMNFTDTLGVNSSGVIQSDNATDVEVNGVSVGLGATLPLDGKLNHINFVGLTAVDITVFGRSGAATNYFDGIPSDVKITDKSGVEDVTTTFALDSGKGVSVEYSLEGNNSLTRINVADEDIGLYTKTDNGWLGQERAHQLLADWPIKNGAVTQTGIGVFDINYSGAFTNILRDSNMFNLGDTVQWSFNVSNYNSGGGDLFIGNTGVSNFNSDGVYSGVNTATVTDGRFAYLSATMDLTLSSLSAKRLIPIATQV